MGMKFEVEHTCIMIDNIVFQYPDNKAVNDYVIVRIYSHLKID